MKKLAVLVSGNGSNLQAIIDSTKCGILKNMAKVCLVVSNNANAYALERARNEAIKNLYIKWRAFEDDSFFDREILKQFQNLKIDIICLAGFNRILGKSVVKIFDGKILNIHPSLLPKFGGKGMYGRFVHEAVIQAGEKKSGSTVHFVDENYDTGKIIIQEAIDVLPEYTPNILAKKVLEIEHKIYPKAIKKIIEN
ncbi:MAG: phosphoribosylglycinamide formyltransferase [Elusimicrobiota bacterium]|jgi:phosphoribosylglycinamide formyltransferase-1|nr:phosphoribosylglycinamide formyltransferase [Elusimicrobiota bacterium]